MPFREFSSYFPTDELDAFTAAYEAAWQHLCATGTTHDQAGVLKKNLAQIILASACKGEREVEQAESYCVRVQTHSNPERDDGGEDDGGQEVEGELVVASGNAPEVLEATEGCFDPPAITIAPFIVADGAFA
jgi:hypothetical protein